MFLFCLAKNVPLLIWKTEQNVNASGPWGRLLAYWIVNFALPVAVPKPWSMENVPLFKVYVPLFDRVVPLLRANVPLLKNLFYRLNRVNYIYVPLVPLLFKKSYIGNNRNMYIYARTYIQIYI